MSYWQRRELRNAHREKKRAADVAGTAMVADLPDEDRLEKEEQRKVVKLYRAMGCTVYSLSQPRATMQTQGIGDLFVVCQRKGVAFWHETKRRINGKLEKQRAEQREFEVLMQFCAIGYVLGGYNEAYRHLQQIGVIVG